MPRQKPSPTKSRILAGTGMTNEEGSAALEFITIGVILLVPLVYLVIALGTIQGQTLGVEAAARHTVRALAQSASTTEAHQRGELVLANVAEQYGIDPETMNMTLTCVPAGVACPAAGATVILTVSAKITLPFMPEVFGLDKIASVPVEATSAQKVSRLWRHNG